MHRQLTPIVSFVLACLIPLVSSGAENHRKAIHLGATVPLSGNLASYGEQIRHGMELAASDLNLKLKAQGSAITLHFEDTPMSGPAVLSAFRKLNDSLKVSAIAGNFSNVAMLTMVPVLRKSHMVAMHTAAMDDEILAAGQGSVFSTNSRVRDEAARMAKYAVDSGYHRVAIVTIETNFGVEYRKHFKSAFEVLGGSVVADESYQLGDIDYRTQLARVKAAKPDAIFAATFGHFLGLTIRQVRELGEKAQILSVYEAEDDSVLSAAGSHADGLRYFVSYDPSGTEGSVQVRNRLAQRLGKTPSTFSLNAYDATTLLATALVSCKGNGSCVSEWLHNVKTYEGISGVFSIAADGAAERQFHLREIREGRFSSAEKGEATLP
jgi:branched-chain amino acid transport system substrate-binding protein